MYLGVGRGPEVAFLKSDHRIVIGSKLYKSLKPQFAQVWTVNTVSRITHREMYWLWTLTIENAAKDKKFPVD
jgi:hypothetical protein